MPDATSYFVGHAVGNPPNTYELGLASLEGEPQRDDVALYRALQHVDGVGSCRLLGPLTVIVEVGGTNRRYDLAVLARVVRLLQARGLHNGRIHGPLAEKLQPVLDATPSARPIRQRHD